MPHHGGLDVGEIGGGSPVLLIAADEGLLLGDAEAVVEFLDDAVGVGKGAAVERAHPLFHDEPTTEVDALELDGGSAGVDDLAAAGVEHAEGGMGGLGESAYREEQR